MSDKIKVQVYIDDGRVYEYEVDNAAKGQEHSAAIVIGGYRHNSGAGYLEHYPPHRILKVKIVGDIQTNYTSPGGTCT